MGRVIDAAAMYQAGRGAGPQGVKEYDFSIAKEVGRMIIDSTVRGYSKLEDFREKSEAQTALIDLKIDKISKKNLYLKDDILSWKVDYDKGAKCATFGIGGKKRKACREAMASAMAKLIGANESLSTFKGKTGQAQGSMHLENGGTLPGGEGKQQEFENNLKIAPYAIALQRENTYDQGNGDMAKHLKFDRKTGELMYLDPKTGKAIPYSKINFAPIADDKMVDEEMLQYDKGVKWGYTDKPLPFNEENEITKIFGRINKYDEKQFKTWYFGGTKYDYNSSAKIPETALAYQHLIQLAIDDKLYINGDWIDKEKHGPGSADWETKMTALKLMSMKSGSTFRHEAARESYRIFKEAYDGAIEQYGLDKEGWDADEAAKNNKWDPNYRWNNQNVPRDTWTKNFKPFINKINSKEDNIPSFAPLIRGEGGVYALRKVDGQWQAYTSFTKDNADGDPVEIKKWVNTTIDDIGINNDMTNYITPGALPSKDDEEEGGEEVVEVNPLQVKINKERLRKREEELKKLEIKKGRYNPEEYEQKLKDIDNKYPIKAK